MSPVKAVDHWIQVGDELLADGEWHDGLELMHTMSSAIPPGMAERETERDRRRSSGRRSSRRGSSEIEERVRPLSKNRQVSIGRRVIVTRHVHGRVRYGAWEVSPWPVPRNGWKNGGWQIRDLRVGLLPLVQLEKRMRIAGAQLRRLITQEPALEHVTRGRWLYLPKSQLPDLEKRVEIYREEGARRRRDAARLRRHRERVTPVKPTQMSVAQLAYRSGIAPETATKLRQANPQLRWTQQGPGRHNLPIWQLPAWDIIVKEYKAGGTERRLAANRRIAANRRLKREGGLTGD